MPEEVVRESAACRVGGCRQSGQPRGASAILRGPEEGAGGQIACPRSQRGHRAGDPPGDTPWRPALGPRAHHEEETLRLPGPVAQRQPGPRRGRSDRPQRADCRPHRRRRLPGDRPECQGQGDGRRREEPTSEHPPRADGHGGAAAHAEKSPQQQRHQLRRAGRLQRSAYLSLAQAMTVEAQAAAGGSAGRPAANALAWPGLLDAWRLDGPGLDIDGDSDEVRRAPVLQCKSEHGEEGDPAKDVPLLAAYFLRRPAPCRCSAPGPDLPRPQRFNSF
jgi:hypothetical protein